MSGSMGSVASVDAVSIWSAGGSGPPESVPDWAVVRLQQGELAVISLPGDHGHPRCPPRELPGVTPEFLDPIL